MKIVESWLREWVNPNADIKQLAEQLTVAGLEVSEIQQMAADFSGVLVGEVLDVQSHPNADRLHLCQARVGSSETLSIVCGASNVRQGLKTPVAIIGAVLPGDFKIKKAKLRGVESQGMMCSAKELQLVGRDEAAGLLELPPDAPVGMDLRQYLKLNDSVLDIELTANRGDCLSILGIAREVAAINNLNLTKPAKIVDLLQPEHDASFASYANLPMSVKVIATDACPNYVGCVITAINNQVATPAWLRERIEKTGLRCVNPVVDVANYVMLELGQPLHAFALDKVSDKNIIVRYAQEKEKIVLLQENKELDLTANDLVIADNKKVLALAGIMGGIDVAVNKDSTAIFLESPYFVPEKIRMSAQRHGLQSDAAYRFERGVDPKLQRLALARARQLLLEIVGGTAYSSITAVDEQHMPRHLPIILSLAYITKVLGATIAYDQVVSVLRQLGMVVKELDGKEQFEVIAPSYRFDINIAEDLVEEIARIYGYGRLSSVPLKGEYVVRKQEERIIISERAIKNFLVTQGYSEAITYSFVSAQLQKMFDPDCVPCELINPISAEMSVMRTNLWPGLVEALLRNLSHKQNRIRIFETGLCFRQCGKGNSERSDKDNKIGDEQNKLEQIAMVAGVVCGEALPLQWGSAKRSVDFYDVKNDVINLLASFGYKNTQLVFRAVNHLALHPKRCAAIYLQERLLGYIGEMHPQIRQELTIKHPIYMFALDLTVLSCKIIAKFSLPSKFPAIERDLALIVPKAVVWSQINDKIIENGTKMLQHVKIFDIFCNSDIGQEKQSIAVRLRFQLLERTLVDDEVDVLIQNIISSLEKDLGITLRG